MRVNRIRLLVCGIAGDDVQCMGIGITGDEGEPVRSALVQGYLQRIVVGKVLVPQLDDLVQVGEFAVEWPGYRLIGRERALDKGFLLLVTDTAAMSVRRRTCEAI